MENVLECFGNIVGTTNETESDSGLYITDLEALSTLHGLVGTEDWSDIETLLENARRIAILNLNTDLTSLIMKFSKQKPTFRGKIGSHKYLRPRAESGISGVRLLCLPVQHGELTIKSIGTLFNQTGDVNVYVANNYNDEVISLTVPTVARKLTFTDFSTAGIDPPVLTLPMKDEIMPFVEYYIYHENPFEFLTNKVHCSTCSGRSFYFDSNRPRFEKYGYGAWAMAGGFNSDIEDIGNHAANLMKGLVLNVEFKCRVDRLICNESLDFTSDPMAQSYAMAVQHKAASVVLWNIIRSSKLNRVIMQDMETFRDAASYYERRYNGMVRNLAGTIPIEGCMCEKGFTDAWMSNRK